MGQFATNVAESKAARDQLVQNITNMLDEAHQAYISERSAAPSAAETIGGLREQIVANIDVILPVIKPELAHDEDIEIKVVTAGKAPNIRAMIFVTDNDDSPEMLVHGENSTTTAGALDNLLTLTEKLVDINIRALVRAPKAAPPGDGHTRFYQTPSATFFGGDTVTNSHKFALPAAAAQLTDHQIVEAAKHHSVKPAKHHANELNKHHAVKPVKHAMPPNKLHAAFAAPPHILQWDPACGAIQTNAFAGGMPGEHDEHSSDTDFDELNTSFGSVSVSGTTCVQYM